jgi:Endosomal/lysosomal potassium channel TMEM175
VITGAQRARRWTPCRRGTSRFWTTHRLAFRLIARDDTVLVWLNLLLLMFVSFLPFPTAVVGEHGGSPAAAVLYAVAVILPHELPAPAGASRAGPLSLQVLGERFLRHAPTCPARGRRCNFHRPGVPLCVEIIQELSCCAGEYAQTQRRCLR